MLQASPMAGFDETLGSARLLVRLATVQCRPTSVAVRQGSRLRLQWRSSGESPPFWAFPWLSRVLQKLDQAAIDVPNSLNHTSTLGPNHMRSGSSPRAIFRLSEILPGSNPALTAETARKRTTNARRQGRLRRWRARSARWTTDEARPSSPATTLVWRSLAVAFRRASAAIGSSLFGMRRRTDLATRGRSIAFGRRLPAMMTGTRDRAPHALEVADFLVDVFAARSIRRAQRQKLRGSSAASVCSERGRRTASRKIGRVSGHRAGRSLPAERSYQSDSVKRAGNHPRPARWL